MNRSAICIALISTACFACAKDVTELKERTVTPVGTNGGRANSAGGEMSLTFAAGALTAEQEITIETLRDREVPRLRSQYVYELGPDGLQFEGSVTITIAAAAREGEELALANVDGAYPEILDSSTWNRATGEVSARLEHFSSYAVVAIYNPCAGLGCGDGCTVCDPLDPGCAEPAPNPKSCNRSGLCVEAAIVSCMPAPDAGMIDMGTPDMGSPDMGNPPVDMGTPDMGTPDVGGPVDMGTPDTGVVTCNDSFQQNAQPVVDILIVMDNSCSMSEEQQTLGSSFNLLLDTLNNNNVDFHIGVTTTDVDMGGEQGALVGNPTILDNMTPNLSQAFASNVAVGTNGSAFEQGLEASRLALSPPLLSGANAGFLRARSSVALIYVSDENDQSATSTQSYSQFLIGLGGQRRVQANTVAGDVPGGCSGIGGTANTSARYDAVRQATGGAFSSICNPPWSQALTDLGGGGFGYLYEFQLGQAAPGGIISVSVDGSPVPEFDQTGQTRWWSYDPATNTVIFTEAGVPEPGALLEIVSGC